jgi:hypothetical protein
MLSHGDTARGARMAPQCEPTDRGRIRPVTGSTAADPDDPLPGDRPTVADPGMLIEVVCEATVGHPRARSTERGGR